MTEGSGSPTLVFPATVGQTIGLTLRNPAVVKFFVPVASNYTGVPRAQKKKTNALQVPPPR
jgi:hypothetical protein